jgi:hypothetical protein
MDGSKAEQDLEVKVQVNDVKQENHEIPVRHSSNDEGNYCVSVLMVTDHFVYLKKWMMICICYSLHKM